MMNRLSSSEAPRKGRARMLRSGSPNWWVAAWTRLVPATASVSDQSARMEFGWSHPGQCRPLP